MHDIVTLEPTQCPLHFNIKTYTKTAVFEDDVAFTAFEIVSVINFPHAYKFNLLPRKINSHRLFDSYKLNDYSLREYFIKIVSHVHFYKIY